MKLFLSHSSRQKLLVREIQRHLPDFIDIWVDEKDILIGDNLERQIFRGIDEESDYVVLFIDDYASKSDWVRTEIRWALERESRNSRTILLPLVIDKGALDTISEFDLKKRKYISCHDFSEGAISAAANQLIQDLFALEVRKSTLTIDGPKIGEIEAAERTISNHARAFREEIFPFRRSNPITIDELVSRVNQKHGLRIASKSEALGVLTRLKHTHMLSGCYFDEEIAFLANERVDQKQDLNVQVKRSIARLAVRKIENEMSIAVDSGSTAIELITEICGLIEARIIHGLKVFTTSLPAASKLVECLNRMGASDRDTNCRVFLLGGLCRPISLSTIQGGADDQLMKLLHEERIKELDFAFLGANGVYRDEGLANDSSALIATKRLMADVAKSCVGLVEGRKLQIQQRSLFAPFCDKMMLITSGDAAALDLDFIRNKGVLIEYANS